MPASRARTAICSAPLEWPSRPGLPTRNFKRRPSFFETRSISARTSSGAGLSLRAARPTPVGARYSPNASRRTSAHSPVVTSAFAAAMEGGMMLRPDAAASRNSCNAVFTAFASRAARLALELLHLRRDLLGAVKDVAVFEQISLVGEDLLHAQRPLLIERPRQAERFVPGRQLHGARARTLRKCDGEHLDQDAVDVV